nr:hypothetical protein [Tanacetum cinerariifolium]
MKISSRLNSDIYSYFSLLILRSILFKEASENDLTAKIKNVEGKVIGRKPIRGIQLENVESSSAHATTNPDMGKKQDATGNITLKSILKRPSVGETVKAANVTIESGVGLEDFGIVDETKRVDAMMNCFHPL